MMKNNGMNPNSIKRLLRIMLLSIGFEAVVWEKVGSDTIIPLGGRCYEKRLRGREKTRSTGDKEQREKIRLSYT